MDTMLADIWFALILLFLALALALEGFSLGVGALSLFARTRQQRETLMGSISPIWHANLTWVVILGAVLFGAFPLLYSLALSTLYLPVILMLLGLIGRGVGLELYAEIENKTLMHRVFALGSLLAGLGLALGLGGLLSGLGGLSGTMAGGDLRWLSPLAVVLALAVLCAAMLAGACFLIAKTEEQVQEASRAWARALLPLTLIVGAAGLGWLASNFPTIRHNWTAWPGMLHSSLPLALALACLGLCWTSIRNGSENAPFRWAFAGIVLLTMGVGGSVHPWLIPGGITVAQAAGQPVALKAMLWVIGFVLPLIIVYNLYVYRVFKGKVNREGYGLYEH